MLYRLQVLVAFSAFAVLPGVFAQAGPDAGDHEYSTGPAVPGVLERTWRPGRELTGYEDLDVQSLAIVQENQTHFTLHLGLGGSAVRDSQESRVQLARNYTIGFVFRQQTYEIRVGEENDLPLGTTKATLDRVNGVTRASQPLEFEPDSANAGWNVVVPKSKVTGLFQEPILAGTALEGAQVTAWADSAVPTQCSDVAGPGATRCTLVFRDFLDVGNLAFAIHPPANGSLLAYALNPIIPTNGEATTHYFKVQTSNLGTAPATIALDLVTQPADWIAYLPDTYTLQPGESRLALVGFAVPFAHQHGANKTALLQVSSTSDGAMDEAQIPLTIQWVDPPQLSGHHPRLFFHADSSGRAWLDTVPSNEDQPIPMFATSCLACGERSLSVAFQVQVPLSPKLVLGLDADLNQTGRMDLAVSSKIAGDFTAGGAIYLEAPADSPNAGRHVIFEVIEQTVSLQAGDNQLSLELRPTPFSDYVDIFGPTDVVLDLRLQGGTAPAALAETLSEQPTGIAAISPSKSFIVLPLNEFHPLDRELEALGRGSMAIAAPTEATTTGGHAQGAPGITAPFVVALLAVLGMTRRLTRTR